MATGNAYFDDIRCNPEVVDPPRNEDLMDVDEYGDDYAQTTLKPKMTVSSILHELLQCPACSKAMYPPIHQVGFAFMKWGASKVIFLTLS